MAKQGELRYDLFIVHAAADRAWVDGYLKHALGVERDRLITPRDFQLGAPIPAEFDGAVTSSRYTTLVLSPAFLADRWAEFSEQLVTFTSVEEGRGRVVAVTLHPCEPPPRLRFRVGLDCTDWTQWDEQAARLRDLIGSPEPTPEVILCPYPGMVPFRPEDARFFFGREAEIQDLLTKLRAHRFLLVIGSSGSGKSSLVLAGLLPKLADPNVFSPGTWKTVTLRPGATPLKELAARLGGDPDPPEAVVTALLAASPPAQRLLLYVDQLEEVYSLVKDRAEQDRFLGRLKDLRADARCVVLGTMRADFYSDLMESALWPVDDAQQVKIAAPRGDALRSAIVAPAEKVGVCLEDSLVERLLTDAADEPGTLPMLQEALVILWSKKSWQLITRQSYDELGHDGRSGLAVAMATRADATLVELPPQQQLIARRIFLRLVQFGEGRPDTRRQQPVDELRSVTDDSQVFDRVYAALIEHRLLTPSLDDRLGRRVDIAHEMLIIGWPASQQWVRDRRDAEQTRRRLETKAKEWDRLGRGSGALLDEVELPEAEHWWKGPDASEVGVDALVEDFIRASREAVDRQAEDREKARRNELARRNAWIFATLLGVAIVASGFAFWNWSRAVAETKKVNVAKMKISSYSSIPLLYSHRELEAVKTNLQVGRDLHQVGRELKRWWSQIFPDHKLENDVNELENQVRKNMQKVLYGVKEHNRLSATSPVQWVAFSPDDQMIATVMDTGMVQLWKPDGTLISWPNNQKGLQEGVSAVAFSPKGKMIALAVGNKVALLNLDNGTSRILPEVVGGAVGAVAFSRDGKMIAAASTEVKGTQNVGSVQLWNTDSGALLNTLEGHMSVQMAVAFRPDGKMIAAAGWYGLVLWKTDGTSHQKLDGEGANAVAFSPDGKWMATGCTNSKVKIWNSDGKLQQTLLGHGDAVWGVSFSPDSQQVASASNDETVKLWQIDGTLLTTLAGHTNVVRAVAFSQDGKMLASASDDGTVKLWKLGGTGRAVRNGNPLYAVGYGPDGKTILTTSGHGMATLWNPDGTFRKTVDKEQYGPISAVAFSPDGQMFATASGDRSVWLFKSDGTKLRPLEGHTGEVNQSEVKGLSFSHKERLIATAGVDGTVKIWNTDDGKLFKTLQEGKRSAVQEEQGYPVWGICFSPDDRMIAAASHDGTVKRWRWSDGTSLPPLKGHGGAVTAVAFSRDSKMIASASDRTVKLWNSDDGTLLKTLEGHQGAVRGVAFSPKGREIIASASEDKTVKLWTRDGTLLKTLEGHENKVVGVAFSPDGKKIVSGSDEDGTAILWNWEEDLNLDRLLEYGCDWVRDYLKNNTEVEQSDRQLCDGISDTQDR